MWELLRDAVMHGSCSSNKSEHPSVPALCPLPFILRSQESSALRSKYWSRICALNFELKQKVTSSPPPHHSLSLGFSLSFLHLSVCCKCLTLRFSTTPSAPHAVRNTQVSGARRPRGRWMRPLSGPQTWVNDRGCSLAAGFHSGPDRQRRRCLRLR